MITRGSVVSIQRTFLKKQRDGGPASPIPDERPAICLLPEYIAAPFGAQIVIQGTTKRGQLPAEWPSPEHLDVDDENLDALEFGRRWDGHDARPTAWKAYHLGPASLHDAHDKHGTVREGWNVQARRELEAILLNPAAARSAMQRRKERAHSRKEIHVISEGDILDIDGKQLLVLSNQAVHRHFRYGIVFVCPLLDGASLFRDSASMRSLRGMRVAWELTQHLELECIPFERTSAAEGAAPELVADVRKHVLRFWSGTTPDRVTLEPFQEYLRLCATQRRAEGGKLSFGSSDDVKVRRFEVAKSRTILPAGRHFSGGTRGALPGDEVFELVTGSNALQLTIKRVGSRVTAIFERHPNASLQILYAHVATENDEEVSYVGQRDIRATYGLAMAALGVATAGEPMRRCVEVGTTVGRETFEVELLWNLGIGGGAVRR